MVRYNTTERMRRLLWDAMIDLTQQPVSEPQLYPARGYWTHIKQDVMAWQGNAHVDNILYSIGSWDSMTQCLRRGFEISDLRGHRNREVEFEIMAKSRSVK